MADINSSQPNSNAPVALERAAIKPITDDEVLSEYLRSITTANKKENLSFYRGIITGIYDDKNEDYRVNDIFYDFGAEQDKNNNTNSSNNDKKILLVHVPSFTTSNIISVDKLSYDNFNKLRVIYNGKEQVQVGYIVFLEFEDKVNFLKPRIKEVFNTESSFLDNNKKTSSSAFISLENNILDINPPQTQEQIFEEEITAPVGGYEIALKAINNVFDANFIETFISFLDFLDSNEFGDLSRISIKLLNLTTYQELLNYINTKNIPTGIKIIPSDDSSKEDYLIYGYVEVKCENASKINDLTDRFFKYARTHFSTSYYYTFNFNNNEFNLDINLNLVNKKEKSLENYLETDSKALFKQNYIKNVPISIITDNISDNVV